jgi:hypothetical protein
MMKSEKKRTLYTLKFPSEQSMEKTLPPARLLSLETTVPAAYRKLPEISVGYLPCFDLIKLAEDKEKLDGKMKALLEVQDFHLLKISCSFNPGQAWTIKEAILAVNVEERSIVYDMEPTMITKDVPYADEIGVTFSLKVGPVQPEIKYLHRFNGIRTVPKLWIFGRRTAQAKWIFKCGDQNSLFGEQDLALIVMTPKGGDASINLELEAVAKEESWLSWFSSREEIPPKKKHIRVGPTSCL